MTQTWRQTIIWFLIPFLLLQIPSALGPALVQLPALADISLLREIAPFFGHQEAMLHLADDLLFPSRHYFLAR